MSGSGRHFLVAGAGLAGSLMAIYLGKAGHRVDVYEGRPDPRAAGYRGGRSINLAISTRGIHALELAGLKDDILATGILMRGRMMHDPNGALSFQPYGFAGQAIHSISRGGLNLALLQAAGDLPGVRLHFRRRIRAVNLDDAEIVLEGPGDGEVETVRGDAIVGADGAFSAVRATMQRLDRFDYSQSYLEHGYKELTIPPAGDGGFRLEPNALHIWPRGGFMMIALPNRDGSFTCTLFWPFRGPASFETVRTAAEARSFFAEHFPDAVPHMPDLADEFERNPVSSLVTVRARPWTHRDKAVLVGDACHAVVPFYGQGANAAFEDCVALREQLAAHPEDLGAAFRGYESARKEHADALADLAIANFLEMRDHVASPGFLWKKRLEKLLHRLMPTWYLPLYSMVTFSRIPYAEAVRRHRRQQRIVRRTAWAAVGAAVVLAVWIAL